MPVLGRGLFWAPFGCSLWQSSYLDVALSYYHVLPREVSRRPRLIHRQWSLYDLVCFYLLPSIPTNPHIHWSRGRALGHWWGRHRWWCGPLGTSGREAKASFSVFGEMFYLYTVLDSGANLTCNESFALVVGEALFSERIALCSPSTTSILTLVFSTTANPMWAVASQFPNLWWGVTQFEVNPCSLPASLAVIWAAFGALCKVVEFKLKFECHLGYKPNCFHHKSIKLLYRCFNL
jgi:hypothetical protein